MSLIRKLGFAYFALFVIVAAMSYARQFKDTSVDLVTRILANLPHLAIGGFATYAGFILSKRDGETA